MNTNELSDFKKPEDAAVFDGNDFLILKKFDTLTEIVVDEANHDNAKGIWRKLAHKSRHKLSLSIVNASLSFGRSQMIMNLRTLVFVAFLEPRRELLLFSNAIQQEHNLEEVKIQYSRTNVYNNNSQAYLANLSAALTKKNIKCNVYFGVAKVQLTPEGTKIYVSLMMNQPRELIWRNDMLEKDYFGFPTVASRVIIMSADLNGARSDSFDLDYNGMNYYPKLRSLYTRSFHLMERDDDELLELEKLLLNGEIQELNTTLKALVGISLTEFLDQENKSRLLNDLIIYYQVHDIEKLKVLDKIVRIGLKIGRHRLSEKLEGFYGELLQDINNATV